MKNGFRTPASGSKKDQLKTLDTELKNVQMAMRVSQLMTQQLMSNVKSMSEDLGSALNQLYELQYKSAAIEKALNLDAVKLNSIANEKRLEDFNAAALKADEREQLISSETATPESTITITSKASDEKGTDKGIFRSRIKLSESGVPDLVTALTGKRVGEKVKVKLNDLEHEVELLSIKSVSNANLQEATH